jgi:hypothetical protein
MEIKKLLTLSQFVEYLYSEYKPSNKVLINAHKAECFDLIVNYMQFLKQPLTKEMFFNPLNPEPECTDEKETDWHFWRMEERNVIFNGWRKSMYHTFRFVNGAREISFANADWPKLYNGEITVTTLNNLAEETEGTFELKNVNL